MLQIHLSRVVADQALGDKAGAVDIYLKMNLDKAREELSAVLYDHIKLMCVPAVGSSYEVSSNEKLNVEHVGVVARLVLGHVVQGVAVGAGDLGIQGGDGKFDLGLRLAGVAGALLQGPCCTTWPRTRRATTPMK